MFPILTAAELKARHARRQTLYRISPTPEQPSREMSFPRAIDRTHRGFIVGAVRCAE